MKNIYFISPANSSTGGPTLLHQAAFQLRKKGFNCFIFYENIKKNIHPVAQNLDKYEVPFETDFNNINKDDIIVIPEQFNFIKKYAKLKCVKVIWWLSVDNFIVSKFYSSIIGLFTKGVLKFFLKKEFSKFEHFEFAKNLTSKNSKYLKNYTFNWAQSTYAIDFLKSIDYQSNYVGDYIVDDFFDNNDNVNKKNIICYSPAKGFKLTKKLIKLNRDFNFVPIQNMSPKQVKELLLESKVYIDFGNHPGQDRIPREARLCQCVVITANRGSAKYFRDVPIAYDYKFDLNLNSSETTRFRSLILDVFNSYDVHIENQKQYLNYIKGQEENFIEDVYNAMQKIIKINE